MAFRVSGTATNSGGGLYKAGFVFNVIIRSQSVFGEDALGEIARLG